MGFFRDKFEHFTGLALQREQLQKMDATLQETREELQYARTLLSGTNKDAQPTRTGNAYSTYASQVAEIAKKYECTATWGNQLRNLINLRAFFTIGGGIMPVLKKGKEDKTKELDYIKAFVEHNNLDEEVPQLWCREAEIEGKSCLVLQKDTDTFGDKMAPSGAVPTVRYIPWEASNYRVTTFPNDYTRYKLVKWDSSSDEQVNETGESIPGFESEGKFKEDDFIYMRFGGRLHKPNDTPPPMAQLLKQIEDMDKALWDWRHTNHLIALPTPHLNFDSGDPASDHKALEDFKSKLNARSWWLGKLLLTAGATFSLVSPGEAGLESIKEELIHLAKVISGASGVPVHFMGLPDLLSNRATADNLVELIVASTNSERKTWIGGYEELFKKAIRFANNNLGAKMDEDAVGVRLSELGAVQIQRIIDLMLPLEAQGIISKQTVRDSVPEIDPTEENKRLDEQMKEVLRQMDFNAPNPLDPTGEKEKPKPKEGQGDETTPAGNAASRG